MSKAATYLSIGATWLLLAVLAIAPQQEQRPQKKVLANYHIADWSTRRWKVVEPTTEPPTTVAAEPVTEAPPDTEPVRTTRTVASPRESAYSGESGVSGTPPERIKQCESHGDYTERDANGHYGAWQFALRTWNDTAAIAGRDDLIGVNPADASPADQDAMAAHLWNGGNGAGQWECK